ncbi:glycosyl hydrolase [Clostridium estertheticum]|uniref:glycosyl hydrolase family 18 protein n=1 Tax=Clostridium estertheticum TaxID=238834 RepID=UPI001C7CF1AF|nr:glycosyl hydrolase family 18 protein [Clostridium estertheticum]MBX4259546.1 glycosyl hydrolase [Clostridium estertheticum]WLC70838.1 glycosyl hydrolase [Clostridium estertheticum]
MNNNEKKNLGCTGLIILSILLISAICIKVTSTKSNNVVSVKATKVVEEKSKNLSAWVAYWDLSSDKEIRTLDKQLKNICYFAGSFNSNNKLVMPDKLTNYYEETKGYDYIKYITIVNDKTNSDGSSLLKDTNLLKSLLSNSELRSSHIQEIIDLAVKYQFDGIEIDYEQIKNDIKLWDNYILFINELYQKSEIKGLKLRVVLQPDIPFDKLNFDRGPTYVFMCYNLHGGFSKPGEKSNPKFIRQLIEKTSKIPGNKDFAIATGGFNWASNDKTTPVSEIEADRILKKYGGKIERDKDSLCLFFNYKDENNIKHEVWYADKITLTSWKKVIIENGYNISIWRLGGNLF